MLRPLYYYAAGMQKYGKVKVLNYLPKHTGFTGCLQLLVDM